MTTAADVESLTRRLTHSCDVYDHKLTEISCPHTDEDTPTAEQVARVVAGIPAIGRACAALLGAGWRASIAGNRITVNDEVHAQFIGASIGRAGGVDPTWVIYAITGVPSVWVVGAEHQP